jgi:outer membrane protein W
MKKNVMIACLVLVAASASYAQEFKKFRVGLGLGYAMASGEGSSGGVLFALEPAYRIKDNLSVGLRIESALVTRGASAALLPGSSIDVAAISSYTLNGQYYLGEGSSFRPFVGAGLGIYSLGQVNTTFTNSGSTFKQSFGAESQFGFYPRVGFDYGHFNVALDYNFIPSTKINSSAEFKNSYFGFRLGFFLGGGKK